MSFRSSFLKHGALVVVSALPLSLLTGCALGTLDLSGPNNSPVTVHANIGGTVHGGQQPISYSQLQIVAVGTTGYGSQGTILTTKLTSSTNQYYPGGSTGCNTTTLSPTRYTIQGGTATFAAANSMIVGQLVTISDSGGSGISGTYPVTAATTANFSVATTLPNASGTTAASATPICYNYPVSDQNGNFLITGDYTCSTGTGALIAITASGGNPGISPTTNNPAIALIAGLGTCGNPASTVILNELTTAATAFAMAQYYTTTFGGSATDTFGAPNTTQGQIGITNAANTIANLVNISTGAAVVTKTNTTASYGSITVTPDSAKLNTIGDILAACINLTPSNACTTLFNSVVTTSGTVPTDTLQAAVYMALNPTSTNASSSTTNITALYGLASGYPQWVGLSAQPTDWTLGIAYGLATADAGGQYPLYEPKYIAVDAGGNIWVANYDASGPEENLVELSPTGTPLYSSGNILTLVSSPESVVVDPSGNVWVSDAGGTTVTEYTTSSEANTFTMANAPYYMASDGKGNIFVLEGAAGELQEISSGGTVSTIASGISGLSSKYAPIAIDSNYNIWIANASAGLLEFPYNSGSYPTTPTSYTPTGLSAGETITIDGSNNIWLGNYTSSASGTLIKAAATSPSTGTSYTVTGATSGIEGLVVDGSGDIWVSNQSTTATNTNAVYEMSSSGVELSPTNGFAHTDYSTKAIAVDPSGNVWVGGSDSSSYATELVEIVGAAVPVVTPIAAGLPTSPGGTSKLGSKP